MLTATQLETILRDFHISDADPDTRLQGRERLVEALLAELVDSGVSGGGGGGGGITQSDILAAINAANFNTASAIRYQFVLREDDNGTYLVRIDKGAGTLANLTLAGANYAPVNPRPVDLATQTPVAREIKVDYFESLVSGANFVAGDPVERVQVLDVSGTPTVVATIWQTMGGVVISPAPVVGTDVQLSEDSQLAALGNISSVVSQVLSSVGSPSDVSTPATNATASSIKGLIRKLLNDLGSINGLVDGIEGLLTGIANSFNTANNSLTTLNATATQTEANTLGIESAIGNTTDVSIPAGTNSQATVKGLLRLILTNLSTLFSGVTSRLDTTNQSLSNLEANTDNLETLSASANTTLGNIDTGVTSLGGQLTTTNNNLTAINGNLDSLETLVGSTNTALGTIGGYVDGLEGLVGATNTALTLANSSLVNIDNNTNNLETLVAGTNTALGTTNSTLATTQASISNLETIATADSAVLVQTRNNTASSASAVADPVGDGQISDTTPSGTNVTLPRFLRAILASLGAYDDTAAAASNTAQSSVKGILRRSLAKLDTLISNTSSTNADRPNRTEIVEIAGVNPSVGSTPVATSNGTAKLYSLLYNNRGTAHFLQIHVGAAAPVNGVTPVRVYQIFANSKDGYDNNLLRGLPPIAVPSGSSVYIVRSSTQATYTAVTLTAANAVSSEITIERSW